MSTTTKYIKLNDDDGKKIYLPPVVIAIGVFDGVHDGHKKLISETTKFAQNFKAEACVFTFWPHPTFITNKKNPKFLICEHAEKIKKLSNLGISAIFEQKFDKNFSQKSPKDFIKYLNKILNLKGICIGNDFKFGKNKAGDIILLKNLLKNFDVNVRIIEKLKINDVEVSSSLLRDEIINFKSKIDQ